MTTSKCLASISKKLASRLAVRERLHLWATEFAAIRDARHESANDQRQPRIFNIDLHISVTEDLRQGFKSLASYTSWNASNHNIVFRPERPYPDPIAIVNQRTWRKLTNKMAHRFFRRYKRFLNTFDFFAVTYPPAFAMLFKDAKKPTLMVIAIRYDWPMSRSLEIAKQFDAEILAMSNEGLLTIVANNQGDADYFYTMTKFRIKVIPSLCDYVLENQYEDSKLCRSSSTPIYIQSARLTETLKEKLFLKGYRDSKEAFPGGYSWQELKSVPSVFHIPYSISTMTLFELATLGVRVIIPDDDWLVEMALSGESGALSELAFPGSIDRLAEVSGGRLEQGSEAYYRWWLERADFANQDLMPNVHRVSQKSFDEDMSLPEIDNLATEKRNARIYMERERFLDEFLNTSVGQKRDT